MQNKVEGKDFDRYTIPVSLTNLFGKKKNIYLFTELEKRHPCFNDEFCIDSILKIDNKKIVYDVLVMKKIKCMEYKKNIINGLFGFRVKDSILPYRFVNKTLLIKLILITIIVIFIFFMLIKKGVLVREYNKTEKIIETVEHTETGIDEFFEEKEECFLYKDFLKITKEKEGKLESFKWQWDGYFEEFSCIVNNVFPENYSSLISDLNSIVEYKNGNPCFVVNYKQKKNSIVNKRGLENQNEVINQNESKSLVQIRNALLENGMEIMDEKSYPFGISFYCKNFGEWFENLNEILKRENLCISGINIKCNEGEKAFIELIFDVNRGYEEGFDITLLTEYESLFIQAKKISAKKEVQENQLNKKDDKKVNLRKIGTIGYENGEKLVFYKDELGKIIRRMEE